MATTPLSSRVSVYLGIEKDRDGKQIPDLVRANALTQIRRIAAEVFGGYTLFNGAGGWINPRGELVEEASIRLDLFSDAGYDAIWRFAQDAGTLLNQSTVLVDLHNNTTFIDVESVDHYGEIRTVASPVSQSTRLNADA